MPNRRIRTPFFWEEAPFFRPVLALIAGILLYDLLRPAPECRGPLLALILAPPALLAATAWQRAPGLLVTMLQRASVPLAFAALGGLAALSCDPALQPGVPRLPPRGPVLAVVSSEPRTFGGGQSFTANLLGAADDSALYSLRGGARIVAYDDSSGAAAFRSGDTLLLRDGLERIRNNGNPFEPDLAAAMRRKGLCFRMQARAGTLHILGRTGPGARGRLQRIHDAAAMRLKRHLTDPQAFGLIQAMLLGDEAAFDPALRGLYADTGIIHIVSISGSHVAMLFALIATLLRWIPGARGNWIRYGAGLIAVWLYVLVAGAPPSALRSAVMFSVVALSALSKREGRGLNTLCMAAFILLLGEPGWLYAPGFQLSFAAVLSLMLFYKPLLRLVPVRSKLLRWAWQAVCASVAAEILTAPIVIWYFHSFPLMFIPANLLAGIVIGGAGLIGGLLVVLVSPLPLLATATANSLGWMLRAANEALAMLQWASPEALRHLYLGAPALLLLLSAILLLALAWLRAAPRLLPAGIGVLCILAALHLADAIASRRQQRLFVYSNGRQALIDEFRGTAHLVRATAASDYHAAGARTALHAWRPLADTGATALFRFGGERILILADSGLIRPAGRLPVDVLILTQHARRLRIDAALQCFSPATLVLAGRTPDRRRRLWADSCRQHHIRFHDVSVSGAWQPG